MERIKKFIKYFFIDNKILWLCLLLTLIFFGNMSKLEFSRCTYRMYAAPFMDEYNHYIIIGRYIVALFWGLVSKIGLSIYETYAISFFISILSITMSIFVLFNILKKYINNKFLNLLLSTGVIINCFLIDYCIYIEKGIFALSILLCILATKFLIEYLDTKKKINLLYSTILLILSSFSYQGTVALFIALSTIFIVKYSDSIKKFIINNLITASVYGFTMGISYLLVRLLGSKSTSRTTGNLDILESIRKVVKGMKNIILDSYGVMPKYFFIAIFIIVFSIISFIIFRYCDKFKNNKKESNIVVFLGFIYILLACVITSVLPQLFIDVGAVNISARAIYPFASIIWLSIIYLLVNVKLENKVFINIFLAIILVFLSVQCYKYNRIITDHYILNYVEKEYALNIKNHIEEYEKQNNIEIKNIIFYEDANCLLHYDDLESHYDINERVFRTKYCRIEIINYFMNRRIKQLECKNEKYEKEFKSIDYNCFDESELKFEGDTLHLCVY